MKWPVLALLLLASSPVAAQTVGVRHVQFVHFTYTENRNKTPDSASDAAQLLSTLNSTFGLNSYGKLQFTGEHAPYVDLDVSWEGLGRNCDRFNSAVLNALQAAVPPSSVPNTVRVTVFQQSHGCAAKGATGGSILLTFRSAVVHEMGHVFGRTDEGHCIINTNGVLTSRDYCDTFDPMGSRGGSQFSSGFKQSKGWFDATYRQDEIRTSQTVTLLPADTMTPGLKAIRVCKPITIFPNTPGCSYTYLDYVSTGATPGVPVRPIGIVWDLDPTAGERWVLAMNQPYVADGFTVTLLSMSPTGAVLQISFGAAFPAPTNHGRN